MLDRLQAAWAALTDRDPGNERWWNEVFPVMVAGERVTAASALRVPVYLAGITVKSRSVSSLPLKIYARDANGDKKRAATHPLNRVLRKRANKEQTAREFRALMQFWLDHYNAAYAAIVPDEFGPVGQLIPLNPAYMWGFRHDGEVWWRVTDPNWTGDKTLHNDQVFKLRRPPYRDDNINPIPTFDLGRDVLAKAQVLERFSTGFFRNGRGSGGTVEMPGDFENAEKRNEFIEWLHTRTTGPNAHKPVVMPHGAKYVPPALKNNEAQFIETKTDNAYDQARLLNIQPHKVGLLDKATFSNIEEQSLAYIGDSLIPDCVVWEDAILADLIIADETFFAEHDLNAALRASTKDRYEAYAKALGGAPWMVPDEPRGFENMNRLPGGAGQDYHRPLNMSGTNGERGPARGGLAQFWGAFAQFMAGDMDSAAFAAAVAEMASAGELDAIRATIEAATPPAEDDPAGDPPRQTEEA